MYVFEYAHCMVVYDLAIGDSLRVCVRAGVSVIVNTLLDSFMLLCSDLRFV